MADTLGEATVPLEVVELVAELGRDSESIFEEGDNNEEASNGGNVGFDGLANLVDDVLELAGILLNRLHYVFFMLCWN